MATRTITTRLALDGEKQFKDQMSSVNREMRGLREEMKLSESQFKGQANSVDALTDKQRVLSKQVEQQQEKVRALEGALEDASSAYGETDKRTDDFRQSLTRAQRELLEMNRELQDTEKYLDEAKRSASGTADSIDEFGKAVKDAGDDMGGGKMELSLENLVGSVGNLKGLLAGGAVGLEIGAITEIAGAVMDLEESTREWRAIMGGLEVSGEQAGYAAEETAEAYDYLYGVLGDAQTTATTVANLQAIGLEQAQLLEVIDMTTGAWNKYGDSIPIDGLAESINETIRAGQITGTFADVINWGSEELQTFGVALKENVEFAELDKKELEKLTEAQRAEYEATKEQYEAIEAWNQSVLDAKTSEDYFNLALQECETQADRTNLVLQTMSEQGLADAGQAYRDLNEDIVTANNSQNEVEQAWGQLGETVAPIADFFRGALADALGTVNDVTSGGIEMVQDLEKVFADAAQRFDEWVNSASWERMNRNIDKLNEKMKNTKWGDGTQVSSLMAMSATMDAIPHAHGLPNVPYDGYLAELHQGEAVLTAQEAELWRALQTANAQQRAGVTAADLQQISAATVNGISSAMAGGGGVGTIVLKMNVNGREFYSETIDDLRAVQRSSPEVTDDR